MLIQLLNFEANASKSQEKFKNSQAVPQFN